MMPRIPHLLLALFLSSVIVSIAWTQDQIPSQERAFFEEKVRPILVAQCYECHSTDSQEVGGKLLLDTRAGILKGGESGPAVVPGSPEKSLLLDAIHYESFEMPPDKPLSEAEIHIVSQWIQRGAWDPRTQQTETGPKETWSQEELWSFYPRRLTPPPIVKQKDWPRGPIDQFVLHRMEQAGAQPTGDAELRALVRRLYYDLIGLAPSMQEIDSFVQAAANGNRQRATQDLVDDLLSRPQFGEHWARHWLDVARYGESNGNDGLSRNATFPHAWRYRDYVIDAINRDVPYDRFLTEQIAGDLLPAETAEQRNRLLVATGFLAIGSKPASAMNKDFAMDIVDDQINAVSTAVMGLSVACARCHDHKHDPIPTRDYYALAGIFKSSETLYGAAGNEKLTAPPTPLHVLQSELPDDGKLERMRSPLTLPTQYTERLQQLQPIVNASLAQIPDGWKEAGSSKFSETEFAQLKESYFRAEASDLTDDYSVSFWFKNKLANDSRPITAYLFSRGELGNKMIPGDHLGIGGKHDPKRSGRLFVFNGNEKKKSVVGGTVIIPGTWNHVVMVRKGDQVRVYLNGAKKPEIEGKLQPTFNQESQFSLGGRSEGFAPLSGNLAYFSLFSKTLSADEIISLHEASQRPRGLAQLGLAMGVRETKKPTNCKVHINGTGSKLGAEVPRGALSACWKVVQSDDASSNMPDLDIPVAKSGRLELAAWLTDPRQPQTWRVIVNRVWLKLMGEGLVATPDDFGVFGARPTNPELLDWLAEDFVTGDRSIKTLIRSIVLSRTYQLSSNYDIQIAELDPGNRLLTRHRKRRLSAEQLRDSMLQASGMLNLSPGQGSPIQEIDALINKPPYEASTLHQPSNHRSIYLCYMRNAPPAQLAAFDLPDGLKVTGRRSQTVLPAQSLFLLNSPFVIQQAEALAARISQDAKATTRQKIAQAFHYAFQREPTESELVQAVTLLDQLESEPARATDPQSINPWAVFCQSLFAANEFRYVD